MSEQILPGIVPAIEIDGLRRIKAVAGRTMEAIQKPRHVRARNVVRRVVGSYSADRLAAFGWTADDIRRFRSM